ncbi:peptide-binding protein [[Phormidium ambiguum] IAM M-71]|uniref:Peptide-binding protein n=1 Tax=[Phormidium ambiguum] IAM M-71 TaxID=454136 RepID=A0A1U7I966_9CYAN|nr:SH3 domain-containing protein [Phormidium ambiguum]OKH33054.1 peptide-binding protein [Phormidium ambiguum IAM M-71]
MSYKAVVRTEGDPLNVRSTPNGEIIDKLINGTEVEVTGELVVAGRRNWVSIGVNRWVAAEFIVKITQENNDSNQDFSSIKGAKIVATQTDEIIAGGLKVYRTQLIDEKGKIINTVRAVSGRVDKQIPSNVPGSQTPIPFGIYTFNNPGSVEARPGEFGGVWSPVTPTFPTKRGGFGVHYDPSAFKNNSQSGTAGCLGTPTIKERDIVTNFIRTYKPTHLIVQKN